MAVYVDDLFTWPIELTRDAQARRVARRNRGQWCHMWADTLEELHAMAARIGLRREWFQDKPRFPHYDLTPGRRAEALRCGAIESTIAERRRDATNPPITNQPIPAT